MPAKREDVVYMPKTGQSHYAVSQKTLENINNYQQDIINGKLQPGSRLLKELKHFFSAGSDSYDPNAPLTTQEVKWLQQMTPADFMQIIMNTRQPTIFAESEGAKAIDNGEWNQQEYDILGGLTSVMSNVTVYDNGKWGQASGQYVDQDYKATLLAVPGAILNSTVQFDREQIVKDRGIDKEAFKAFYKARLMAAFEQANAMAKENDRSAFITLPGIGNGAFAGEFRGQTIGLLNESIKELLEENQQWNNIGTVILDGYESNVVSDETIGNTLLRVRNTGPKGKNGTHQLFQGEYGDLEQLSKAEEFAESVEEKERFSACERFKIVAWDHFSYEGNDWVRGSRFTDEATLAACDGLYQVCGIKGRYDKGKKGYLPPEDYQTWGDYFVINKLKQSVADRLFVFVKGAQKQLDSNFDQLRRQIKEHNIYSMVLDKMYNFGLDGKGRKHRSPASAKGLDEKFTGKQGDVLKRAILEDFQEQLAQCQTKESVTQFIERYKTTPEYGVLKTPQDATSKILGLKTSSVKALEKMVDKVSNNLKSENKNSSAFFKGAKAEHQELSRSSMESKGQKTKAPSSSSFRT